MKKARSDFPVTKESTYLNCASSGPSPVPVLRAGKDFLERKSRGIVGTPDDWVETTDKTRAEIAGFISAKPSEIAFTTNTTEGTNIVASSLSLGPEDNIVWDDLDHPSNKLVWLHQERTKGVENRVVRSRNGAVSTADFERLVDSRTKVISISHVSHQNGYRHDLKALADLAHAYGAYLHVDAIQSIGAVQVDVKDCQIDFLTCGTYKWLLGPFGLAFFYSRDELLTELQHPFRGWMQVKTWDDSDLRAYELYQSIKKLEFATFHIQGVYELGEALNYLNKMGMERIEKQVLRLSSRLWHRLASLNADLITPPDTRSGVVTFAVSDAQKMARVLAENRIVVTVRGDHVRVSPHFFNTEEEIDDFVGIVESVR